MALALGTNVGFVTVAPTADPAGSAVTSDGSSFVVKDTAPTGAVKITEVGWYKSGGTTSSNTQVGLYSDSAGVAATRLQVTGDQASGTSADVWIRFTGLNWPVTAGTAYWLGMQQDAHTGSSTIDSAASGGSGIDTRTSQTALTNPYGGGAVSDADGMYAIYAVYQTAPTVALSSPADSATGVSTTPDLVFTGTDASSDDVRYNVQIHTDSGFGTITDDFNRSNSSTLGSNWSLGPESISHSNVGPQILSNRAYNEGTSDCDAFYSGASFNDSQFAQATVKSINSGTDDFSGVLVRASATDYVMVQVNKFGGNYRMYWYNGGAYTALGSYSATPTVNDVIRLEAVGTTFYFYLNGVLRITGSDAGAPASGAPGIILSGSNADQSSLDDWSGGDTAVLIDAVSGTDAGFSGTPDNTDPFTSGQAVTYTVQSALSNSTTYYWRVRGIDPSGSNTYGAWATTRSFTTVSAGGVTVKTLAALGVG